MHCIDWEQETNNIQNGRLRLTILFGFSELAEAVRTVMAFTSISIINLCNKNLKSVELSLTFASAVHVYA